MPERPGGNKLRCINYPVFGESSGHQWCQPSRNSSKCIGNTQDGSRVIGRNIQRIDKESGVEGTLAGYRQGQQRNGQSLITTRETNS